MPGLGIKSPWMTVDASKYGLFPKSIEPEPGIQETGFLGDPLSGFVNEKMAIEKRKGNTTSPWMGTAASFLDPDLMPPMGKAETSGIAAIGMLKPSLKAIEGGAMNAVKKDAIKEIAGIEVGDKIKQAINNAWRNSGLKSEEGRKLLKKATENVDKQLGGVK